MSKFDGLISVEDQEIVQSVFCNVDNECALDIVESIENIVYLHQRYFGGMTLETKLEAFIMLATVLQTLLDEEINPLARYYTIKAFKVFNNNIFEVKEGNCNAN